MAVYSQIICDSKDNALRVRRKVMIFSRIILSILVDRVFFQDQLKTESNLRETALNSNIQFGAGPSSGGRALSAVGQFGLSRQPCR